MIQSHKLEDLASFVRDLESECTCLVFHNNALIAGSKKGKIVAWDINDGRELWNLKVDGPISDIEISDRIYLTASAELHAIEITSGKLEWTKDIGGSSDFVKVDKDTIWVTSSLYEIEVQDYTETTLFQFEKNSKLIKSINFEEKPWFMVMQEDNVVLGVGRPRCGYLIVNKKCEISHKAIEGNSPITLGVETDSGFLLGHSDGKITEVKDKTEKIMQFEESPITSILANEEFWCLGNDKGSILSSKNWEKNFEGRIDCLIDERNMIWSAISTNKNNIYLLNKDDGEIKFITNHDSRIRLMKNRDGKIAISDSGGKVIFLEEEIVSRRLNDGKKVSNDSEKRDLLKKRLRALRK